ncbi:MAG: hypothetical protein Q8N16_00555 [bacterium]|nr:hypothetical protein [bacterium]
MNKQLFELVNLLDLLATADPIRIQGGMVWIYSWEVGDLTGTFFPADDSPSRCASEAEIDQGLLVALDKWGDKLGQSAAAQQRLIDIIRGYWAGQALLSKQIGFKEFRRIMRESS